jgi:predicted permease
VPPQWAHGADRRFGTQPFRGLAGPAGTAVQRRRHLHLGAALATGVHRRLRHRLPRRVRLTLAYRLLQKQPLVDASLDALGASYANTGYVGIPLCMLVLGDEALQPAMVASIIVVCVLFAIALACVETGLHAGQGLLRTLGKVSGALVRNPLVIAPMLGALWAAGGVQLPVPLATLLKLLGAAAAPCALVSLGLFLAQPQPAGRVQGVWPLVGLKLVVQPLITWYLAFQVFELPTLWAYSALLLSALPTGTGPYMLAEFYGREGSRVSRVVLYSTLGSLLTLSLILLLLPV